MAEGLSVCGEIEKRARGTPTGLTPHQRPKRGRTPCASTARRQLIEEERKYGSGAVWSTKDKLSSS